MNSYTQEIWEIVGEALFDDETLAADLKKIYSQDYRLFLTEKKSREAYTNSVKLYFLEKLQQWYEWLPDTTINLIGGELALEALKAVEWQVIADEVAEHFEREKSHADTRR